MAEGGFIYAIGAGGTSSVKIGSTVTSAEKRCAQLQIGHPLPLHVLAAVPVSADLRRIEHQIHAFLEAERQQGEWFTLALDTVQLEALIVRAIQYLADKEAQRPSPPWRLGAAWRPHPYGLVQRVGHG
jgi:Meiotically up-regulated gene 113